MTTVERRPRRQRALPHWAIAIGLGLGIWGACYGISWFDGWQMRRALQISDVQWNPPPRRITGTLANHSDRAYENVQFEIILYNYARQEIGDIVMSHPHVNRIEPREIWNFEAEVDYPGATTFEIRGPDYYDAENGRKY